MNILKTRQMASDLCSCFFPQFCVWRYLSKMPIPEQFQKVFSSTISKPSSIQMSHKQPNASHWSNALVNSLNDPNVQFIATTDLVVIRDKYPKAKHHYLILPRADIPSIYHVMYCIIVMNKTVSILLYFNASITSASLRAHRPPHRNRTSRRQHNRIDWSAGQWLPTRLSCRPQYAASTLAHHFVRYVRWHSVTHATALEQFHNRTFSAHDRSARAAAQHWHCDASGRRRSERVHGARVAVQSMHVSTAKHAGLEGAHRAATSSKCMNMHILRIHVNLLFCGHDVGQRLEQRKPNDSRKTP